MFIIISTFICFQSCKKDNAGKQVEVVKDRYRYINEVKGTDIKDRPDAAGRMIIKINFGMKVNLIEEQGDLIFFRGTWGKWSKIKYGEQIGWIFGGYLSEFDILPLKKTAAERYNAKYMDLKTSEDIDAETKRKLTARKESDIKIKAVMGNLAVVVTWGREHSIGDPAGMEEFYLWTFTDGKWDEYFYTGTGSGSGAKFFVSGYKMELFYLNNDCYPDVTLYHGEHSLRIFLGAADGKMRLLPDPGDSCQEKTGNCGQYKLTACIPGPDDKPGIKDYIFDCSTDSLKIVKVYNQE